MAKFLRRRKDKDEENEEQPARSSRKRPSASARIPAFSSASTRAKRPFSAERTTEQDKGGRWKSPWNRGGTEDAEDEDKGGRKRGSLLRGKRDADKSASRRPVTGRTGSRRPSAGRGSTEKDEEKKKSGRFGLGLRRGKDKADEEGDKLETSRRSSFGSRTGSRDRAGSVSRTPSSTSRSRFGFRSKSDDEDDAPPSRAGTFRSRVGSSSRATGSRFGRPSPFGSSADDEDDEDDAPPSRAGTFRSRAGSSSRKSGSALTRGRTTTGGLPPRSESQRRTFGGRSVPSVVDKKKEDEEKKKKRRSSILPFGKKKGEEKDKDRKKKSKPAKKPSSPTRQLGRSTGAATTFGTRRTPSSGRGTPATRGSTTSRSRVPSRPAARTGTTSGASRVGRSRTAKDLPRGKEKTAFSLHQGLDYDRKIDIVGIVLFAFALVTFFAVTPSISLGLLPQPTGGLTGRLDHVFSQLFGWGKVFVPFGVGAVGVWLMKESFEGRGIPIPIFRVLGVLLLFTGTLAWLHMIELFNNVQPSVEAFRPYSYALAVERGRGGGWVGHEIYVFLLSQLLDFGTISVLIAWMVMGAILTFDLTVVQLVAYVTGLFGFLHLRGNKERREARKIAKAEDVPLQRGAGPQPALSAATGAAVGAAAVAAETSSRGRKLRRRQATAEAELTETDVPARPTITRRARPLSAPASADETQAETPAESAVPLRPTAARRPLGRRASLGARAGVASVPADEEAERDAAKPATSARSRFGLRRKRDEKSAAVAETASTPTEQSAAQPARKERRLPFGRLKRGEQAEETSDEKTVPAASEAEVDAVLEKTGRRRLGLGLRRRGREEPTDPASEAQAATKTTHAETSSDEGETDADKARRGRLGGFLKRRKALEDAKSEPDESPKVADTPVPTFAHARKPIGAAADKAQADTTPEDKPRVPSRRSLFDKTAEMAASADAAPSPQAELVAAEEESDAPAQRSPFARSWKREERQSRPPRPEENADKHADKSSIVADDEKPADPVSPRRPRVGARRAVALGAAAGAGLAGASSRADADDAANEPQQDAAPRRSAAPFGRRPQPQSADEEETDDAPRVPLRPLRPTVSARPSRPSAPKTNDAAEADAPQRAVTPPARSGNRPSVVKGRAAQQTETAAKTPAEPSTPSRAIRSDVIRRRGAAPPAREKATAEKAVSAKQDTASSDAEATRSAADAPTLPLEAADTSPQPAKPSAKAQTPRQPRNADEEKVAATPKRASPPVRRRSTEGRGTSAITASTPAKAARPEAENTEAASAHPSARSAPPDWEVPDFKKLLRQGDEQRINDEVLLEKARVIEDTLASFGAPGKVVEVNPGPVITQFGVEPDYVIGRGGKKTRVKVSAIARLDADLALALAAKSIRIEAPVPGKGFVGIEVPNDEVSLVGLYDIMESPEFNRIDSKLRLALGLSVDGTPVAADLTAMPHLLIAGTTGSGKSVCVNAIISCLLLQNSPEDLQFIMVDPKRVELTGYNGIPHLVAPVVVELERIVGVLQWIQREMEERYRKFAAIAARNILDYNRKVGESGDKLPYYVVVVDELADLMMLAPDETERLLARLAQMARATGIHLIISTQRPSVDIITGLIKANFPARIAFAVVSSVDSRVILDQPGAEKLLGRGDMLFQSPDAAAPLRMQGVFVSDDEIVAITRYWKEQMLKRADATGKRETLASPRSSIHFDRMRLNGAPSARSASGPASQSVLWEEAGAESGNGSEDALYEEAVELVQRLNKASISLLQRRLRIGYTRAARLIDMMEAEGIVGPAESGSKPREVLKRRVESGDD